MAPAFTASSTSSCSPDADRISTRADGSCRDHLGGHLDAVGRGDLQVEHDHLRAGRGRNRASASVPSAATATTSKPGLGQVARDRVAPHRVVVDHHHADRCSSTAVTLGRRRLGEGQLHLGSFTRRRREGRSAAQVLDAATNRLGDTKPARISCRLQSAFSKARTLVSDGDDDAV